MGGGGQRRARPLAALVLLPLLTLASVAVAYDGSAPRSRPAAEPVQAARWDFHRESETWSRAALAALDTHGKPLVNETPDDIVAWCPGYGSATPANRRAFWVGFLSALAKHESRWRPGAVGGEGKWYGLLQILPATARGYGCTARTGDALKNGAANLSCAIRILSRTVPRDGVVHARSPRWSGVSADWGPMRSGRKRDEMAEWLRRQEYCQRSTSPRPMPRALPETLVFQPLLPRQRPRLRPEQRVADLLPHPSLR